MNETISVAIHLLLAVTIAVGVWTIFSAARPVRKSAAPVRKANPTIARTQTPPPAVTKVVEKARRPKPSIPQQAAVPRTIRQEHALPWVIPTPLAPTATYSNTNKTAITVEELSARLAAIESKLDRIGKHAVR